MRKVVAVVGLIWALIGAGNIAMMPWADGVPNDTLLGFGLIFNFVFFVLPGLGLACAWPKEEGKKS